MLDSEHLQRQHRPVSCAECRRLKLRCDRVFPCTTCRKRGCAEICPNGLKPSRKSNRIPTGTQIDPLLARIRELEHALAALQATYSNEPHPLLRKDHRDRTYQVSSMRTPSPPPDSLDQLCENLGTLSMTGYGKSRFFGTTGSVWPHVWDFEDNNDSSAGETPQDDAMSSLNPPPELKQLIAAFPFPKPTPAAAQMGNWIVANLPPSLEAWSLCETFFENGAYIFIPLRRTLFIQEIFSFFYRSNSTQSVDVDIPRGHRLALLLMVFAIGDMLDLTKPAMPTGGKRFYYLARAALSLEPSYDQPTLTVVQTLVLMTVYLSMSDHKEAAESVYVLSGLNLRLALMLGLHRESLKFNMNQPVSTSPAHIPRPVEEELRRVIFHEVIHFETWQCLQFGRPSMLHFEHFDCEPPGLIPERENALEVSHMKGQAWSYGFIRSCLIPVLNYAVAVKPPTYSEVMKLDGVIRSHTIPQDMQISSYEEEGSNPSDSPSRAAIMLRFSSYSMREIALLYLHRPYFACAMTDFSADPMGSPYGRSVLASFVSACGIIEKISLLYEKEPILSIRIWIFWNQLFVPCILCTIIARSPSCNITPTALTQLDKLCELLGKAKNAVRASKIYPQAIHLRNKARAAYELYYSAPEVIQPAAVDISAELSALAGKSRVSPPSSNSNSPASQPPRSSPAASVSASSNAPATVAPTDQVGAHILYPETDWSSFADVGPLTSSMPLEQHTQLDANSAGTYDYTSMSDTQGLPAAGSSSEWSSELRALFGHTMDPSFSNDQTVYPAVDLQLTWQNFITQMGL